MHTLEHWTNELDAKGLIWAPMLGLPEVVQDPALRERNAFQPLTMPQGVFETVGAPFVIREADISARGPASDAGADTAEVLRAAGLSEEEMADYAARGAFG
jgi:crotonobetainyl-CoA:carnitine CoA-transferase CaiB-like acyl-CoA transferase